VGPGIGVDIFRTDKYLAPAGHVNFHESPIRKEGPVRIGNVFRTTS
jgi:hypothetical protein